MNIQSNDACIRLFAHLEGLGCPVFAVGTGGDGDFVVRVDVTRATDDVDHYPASFEGVPVNYDMVTMPRAL